MRFCYLDFSRSLLFFLGIVLHAAFLCVERNGSFQSIHDAIHSFRMEAFYLIAGFFSALSLNRKPAAAYLKKRIIRLGVPFLFGALVVDTLSNCANHWDWNDFGLEFSRTYWLRGDWLEHLWFLPTLLAYTGVLVLGRSIWPRVTAGLNHPRFSLSFMITVTCLLYFGAIHVVTVVPEQAKLNTFLSIYKTEHYAVFFALGYVFFHRREMLEQIISHPWLNAANVVAYTVVSMFLPPLDWARYVMQLWHPAFCISTCGLLFFTARRLFAEESPVIRSLADASYTVYLVHWPFMIIINRFMAHTLAPLPSLILLIGLTSALSYLFHIHVVKKSPLFAFLFNGQLPEHHPRQATDLTRAAA